MVWSLAGGLPGPIGARRQRRGQRVGLCVREMLMSELISLVSASQCRDVGTRTDQFSQTDLCEPSGRTAASIINNEGLMVFLRWLES
jgi:hypothetical protein